MFGKCDRPLLTFSKPIALNDAKLKEAILPSTSIEEIMQCELCDRLDQWQH
ncbi:hypothetical protein [Microcoleus sp. PH2017_05_CCC_O_A]|uniref:hypothetical protein n=1 Tax=Microcoleus sp. PH2017_05_CCC_O_A TaxID=2798816 RepID=UPI001E13F359|nr:hypothetical protein [Microcoleus sp. PH2017_05_CCC_O_A]MCC3438896.1 hypothetical protein [Microcoleus sp. PH2017_05_CCC_O_A]